MMEPTASRTVDVLCTAAVSATHVNVASDVCDELLGPAHEQLLHRQCQAEFGSSDSVNNCVDSSGAPTSALLVAAALADAASPATAGNKTTDSSSVYSGATNVGNVSRDEEFFQMKTSPTASPMREENGCICSCGESVAKKQCAVHVHLVSTTDRSKNGVARPPSNCKKTIRAVTESVDLSADRLHRSGAVSANRATRGRNAPVPMHEQLGESPGNSDDAEHHHCPSSTPNGTQNLSKDCEGMDISLDESQQAELDTSFPNGKHKKKRSVQYNMHNDARVNPRWLVPFDHGWRRLLVMRNPMPDPNDPGKKCLKTMADAYYYTPTGKKLRSMPQIEEFLAKHPNAAIMLDCFTFIRKSITGEPHETVRSACKTNRGRSAQSLLPQPSTPTKVSSLPSRVLSLKRKGGAHASSPGLCKQPVVQPPAGKKIRADREAVERAKAFLAVSLQDKALSLACPSLVTKKLRSCSPEACSSLGEFPLSRLCSLHCEGLETKPPTLHCGVCMCLFHPECVNFIGSTKNSLFVCLRCLDSAASATAALPSSSPMQALWSHGAGQQTDVVGAGKFDGEHYQDRLKIRGLECTPIKSPPPLQRAPVGGVCGSSVSSATIASYPTPPPLHKAFDATHLATAYISPRGIKVPDIKAPKSYHPSHEVTGVSAPSTPTGGKLITLPSSVISKINPNQPLVLKLNNESYIIEQKNLLVTPKGVKIFLPAKSEPTSSSIAIRANGLYKSAVSTSMASQAQSYNAGMLLNSIASSMATHNGGTSGGACTSVASVSAHTRVSDCGSVSLETVNREVDPKLTPVTGLVNPSQEQLLPPVACSITGCEVLAASPKGIADAETVSPSSSVCDTSFDNALPVVDHVTKKNCGNAFEQKWALGCRQRGSDRDICDADGVSSNEDSGSDLGLLMFLNGYECLLDIFSHLSVTTLLTLGLVCRQWRRLSLDAFLWERVSLRDCVVKDWKRAADFMTHQNVKRIDFGGMTCATSSWEHVCTVLPDLPTVRELYFNLAAGCCSSVLHAICDAMPQLCTLNITCSQPTESSHGEIFMLDKLLRLPNITSVALRGMSSSWLPFEGQFSEGLTRVLPLESLSNLQQLVLTTLQGAPASDFLFVRHLLHLERLELGLCTHWTSENYRALSEFTKLRHLSLIGGDAEDLPFGLVELLKHYSSSTCTLTSLKLTNCKLSSRLAEAVAASSLQYMLYVTSLSLLPTSNEKLAIFQDFISLKKVADVKPLTWRIEVSQEQLQMQELRESAHESCQTSRAPKELLAKVHIPFEVISGANSNCIEEGSCTVPEQHRVNVSLLELKERFACTSYGVVQLVLLD